MYLLRISDGEQSHYVYIKHISRLFNLEKYTDERKCFCPFCNHKVKAEHMEKHLACCFKLSKETGGILKMPKEGSVMQFENYKNQIKRPFMVYADCECSLIATDEAEQEHGKPKCTRKHIYIKLTHVVIHLFVILMLVGTILKSFQVIIVSLI